MESPPSSHLHPQCCCSCIPLIFRGRYLGRSVLPTTPLDKQKCHTAAHRGAQHQQNEQGLKSVTFHV